MSRIQNWFAHSRDADQNLKKRKHLEHKKVKVFQGGECIAYYVGTQQQIDKLSTNKKYEVKQ